MYRFEMNGRTFYTYTLFKDIKTTIQSNSSQR